MVIKQTIYFFSGKLIFLLGLQLWTQVQYSGRMYCVREALSQLLSWKQRYLYMESKTSSVAVYAIFCNSFCPRGPVKCRGAANMPICATLLWAKRHLVTIHPPLWTTGGQRQNTASPSTRYRFLQDTVVTHVHRMSLSERELPLCRVRYLQCKWHVCNLQVSVFSAR